jgi:aspartate racemase
LITPICDSMKTKRLGIIGGLGTETSCQFCLNINNTIKERTKKQPDITLENLPVSRFAEEQMITGNVAEEYLVLLSNTVKRMNKNNNQIGLITIPCNTAHIFINELRKISNIPILNIVEECANECNSKKIKKVGLLATTKTINERLYNKELDKFKIKLITPKLLEQKVLSKIILKIINNKIKKSDKESVLQIINDMKQQGAEAIILGCTDIPILIKENDSPLPIINSVSVLENSAIRFLAETDYQK